MAVGDNQDVLTISQAARYCAVDRVTMWRWIKQGKIRASVTLGGHHRIRKADLESFVFERGMFPLTDHPSPAKRILVVDDDPSVQGMLRKMLSACNYETEAASDGFEAGIKIAKFKPGLVILDLFMPGMDGFEVCKRIKEDPDTSRVKVLILTGYDSDENRDRVMRAGADGYMTKPAEKDTLLRQVEDLLK